MKTFTVEVDRKFEIGGELFEWQDPHWEQITAMFDEDLSTVATTKDGEPESSSRQSMQLFIDRVKIFLPPDQHAKWDALVSRTEKPVPYYQIRDLYTWLIEVATGRPTEQPSSSGDGLTSTEPGSQDG